MSITSCFRCSFIVILLVFVFTSYGQTDPSVAPAKHRQANGGGSGSEEFHWILLPVSAANPLLQAFNLHEFPTFAISAVNDGLLAVQGLPLKKIEGMAEYFAQNPMSTEDYLRFVLPAPVLTGEMELDVEKYDSVLKLFQLIHPEIAWYQPKEIIGIMHSEGASRRLLELQQASGRAISLQNILKVRDTETISDEPHKAVD